MDMEIEEPGAPGTEDELTKKEIEQKRLLSLKAVLKNGKHGAVFDLSFVDGTECWYCNLCNCPVLGKPYLHEIGKRHSNNMEKSKSRKVVAATGEGESNTENASEGAIETVDMDEEEEPIPPGLEGQMQREVGIQETLDKYDKGPLLGLEFLLELQDRHGSDEPSYICMLCDKKGDPRTIITHIISYNHIAAYMQKYFKSVYTAILPYSAQRYLRRNWQNCLMRVAEEIEKRFGRLKPWAVNADTFELNKLVYLTNIAASEHIQETPENTFMEFVNKDELSKRIGAVPEKKPEPPKPQPAPPKTSSDYVFPRKKERRLSLSPDRSKETKKATIDTKKDSKTTNNSNKKANAKGPSNLNKKNSDRKQNSAVSSSTDRRQDSRRSPSPDRKDSRRSRSPDRKDTPRLPWERPTYGLRKSIERDPARKNENDVTERYKKLSKIIDDDMDRLMKQYLKTPEKHPKYNDEWKSFWTRRCKEIQAKGMDPVQHDFKPDWIVYWTKRMRELHDDELRTRKEGLRKRLGLPEGPAPIKFQIGQKPKENAADRNRKPVPTAALPDKDPDVIIIDDRDSRSPSPVCQRPSEVKNSGEFKTRWSTDRKSPERKSSRRSRERSEEKSIRKRSRDRSLDRRSRNRSLEKSPDRKRGKSSRERSVERRSRERSPDRRSDRRSRDRSRSRRSRTPDQYRASKVTDDRDLTVISVLRILTALEERLGSLGPKVNDLLSEALVMDKEEPNGSIKLLDYNSNIVLFETVREKLKGQLIAGLVERSQEKAFNTAIDKTDSLVNLANDRKRKDVKKDNSSVDAEERATIAKQVAISLVLRGKVDVSQTELDQIVDIVVGMTESSRKTGRPMPATHFIEQVCGMVAPKKEPNEPDKNIRNEKMRNLPDSQLQIYIQNFKNLSKRDQDSLLEELKQIEHTDRRRAERLRRYFNRDYDRHDPFARSSDFSLENDREISIVLSDDNVPRRSRFEEPKNKYHNQSRAYDDAMNEVWKRVEENEIKKERQLAEEKKKNEAQAVSDVQSRISDFISKFTKTNTAQTPAQQNIYHQSFVVTKPNAAPQTPVRQNIYHSPFADKQPLLSTPPAPPKINIPPKGSVVPSSTVTNLNQKTPIRKQPAMKDSDMPPVPAPPSMSQHPETTHKANPPQRPPSRFDIKPSSALRFEPPSSDSNTDRRKSPTDRRRSPVDRRRSPPNRRRSPVNRQKSPNRRERSPVNRRGSNKNQNSPSRDRSSPSDDGKRGTLNFEPPDFESRYDKLCTERADKTDMQDAGNKDFIRPSPFEKPIMERLSLMNRLNAGMTPATPAFGGMGGMTNMNIGGIGLVDRPSPFGSFRTGGTPFVPALQSPLLPTPIQGVLDNRNPAAVKKIPPLMPDISRYVKKKY